MLTMLPSFFGSYHLPMATAHLPYTLKVSSRAKFARLKMTPHAGLVVVVPKRFDKKEIPALLLRHEEWIRKAAERLDSVRSAPLPVKENGLPCTIILRHHSEEEWVVTYNHKGRKVVDEGSGKRLLVSCDEADTELCRRQLLFWLKQRAQALLVPSLEKVAVEHGFDFAVAGVRLQHSRWGSCSARRTITLNTKLLFLPEHLVRYIMVHELCHTVHMNHSKAFWALVRRHDPFCRTNNLEMKTAWKYVPEWVSS
ncbi:MAG: SprT family zinc-dependent metalloprotease [Chlorobium sp.]